MNRSLCVRGTMVEDGRIRDLVIVDGVVARGGSRPGMPGRRPVLGNLGGTRSWPARRRNRRFDAALRYLADAVTRSLPARGGHLWSHVWALTDAARLGCRLGDPRHTAWQEEALATAQGCGMRALTAELLQVSGRSGAHLRPSAEATRK